MSVVITRTLLCTHKMRSFSITETRSSRLPTARFQARAHEGSAYHRIAPVQPTNSQTHS